MDCEELRSQKSDSTENRKGVRNNRTPFCNVLNQMIIIMATDYQIGIVLFFGFFRLPISLSKSSSFSALRSSSNFS